MDSSAPGKTTLLNYLLSEEQNLRKEIIIREYGTLSIDHELIEDKTAHLVMVTGGCLFADPQTTLYWALENLYSRTDPLRWRSSELEDVDFDYVLHGNQRPRHA